MAEIVVIGAGLGGMSAAFELRETLGRDHRISVVGSGPQFAFTPSNPWLAVGWREPGQTSLDAAEVLERKDIGYDGSGATAIDPVARQVRTGGGAVLSYDYLVLCTGPALAFDEVPGSGPDGGYTQSVCTLPHALHAWQEYQAFLRDPGPLVVGAVQGASCFGPAYEFAMILDADLRRRKLRDRVPMTFVTSEPYIGHMGLGGVGDSKGLLESELRKRDIKWIDNAQVREVRQGEMSVVTHDAEGAATGERTLPFRYAMLLPAFRGVP